MLDVKNECIIIPTENKFECLQLILWGWISNLKILIIDIDRLSYVFNVLKRIFFIRKYIKESIHEYKISFDKYKGLWHEINKETIDLTIKFYNQEIKNKNKFITYYNKIFNTHKFEAYIKKQISYQIFVLLKDLHLIRLSHLSNKIILMTKSPVNEFVIKYMADSYCAQYQIKWILPIWGPLSLCEYYMRLFIEFIRRGVVFNKDIKSYRISKEATWGFYRQILRDDIIIGNSKFKANDLLMLEFDTKSYQRVRAFKEARERGFETASVPKLKINVNKNIFNILFLYFWIPVKTYLQLSFRQKSYFFYYIYLFHRQCFPVEILMNLYCIKCHISVKDSGDTATTIILNKYGARDVIFHWSDLTFFRAHHHTFIAHNTYFLWGDIHSKHHADNYFVDEKINIGCIFKKEYNKALSNKENIIGRIANLEKERKTVTFFDTSFNNTIDITAHFFLEYMEIIKEFCEHNKDVNVLLKPKLEKASILQDLQDNLDQYKEIWDGLIGCGNFYYLNPLEWSVAEAIAISDVCITMAMTTPSTVALICGKDALYFDNTGNIYHPFAKKYSDVIVFEDKDLLFKQISNILDGKFNCRDAISEREIRKYDAFADDNALERLRENLYGLTLSNR